MTVEQTGITTDSWIIQNFFKRVNRISTVTYPELLPCIFSEIKKNHKNMKTFSLYNWEFFINFGNAFEADIVDKEIFKLSYDSIESYKNTDHFLLEKSLQLIKEDFDFFFLYFKGLDKSFFYIRRNI